MADLNNPATGECIDELETLMVKLFRLFQHLFSIVKDERQHLVAHEADAIDKMFAEKSAILSRIETVESERVKKTRELARLVDGVEDSTLGELIALLPSHKIERIRHIQQGILSLQKEISEINDGNFALANLNLQQVQAVQQFLINALQPPSTYYGPNKNAASQAVPSTWQMDQNV